MSFAFFLAREREKEKSTPARTFRFPSLSHLFPTRILFTWLSAWSVICAIHDRTELKVRLREGA